MAERRPEESIYREYVIAFLLHTEAVADRLGLQSIDVAAAILLEERGPLAVGAIAEALGLPSASATRLIDRLEKAGYVRRVRSERDRRTVIVEPVEGGMDAYYSVAETSQRHLAEVSAHYTPEQAMVMLDMYRRVTDAYRAATAELRTTPT